MSVGQWYDVVIYGGRVMDPESGLDAVRNIGVNGDKIEVVSEDALNGRYSIDASGLVVSPGFIDIHTHGQTPENYEIQVQDGVTTSLEPELGTSDVDGWYRERESQSPVNYGVSIGHLPVRIDVMGDPGGLLPVGDAAHRAASESEIQEIVRRIERGLDQGAPAVGLGLQYSPAASRWEVLEVFRVAARYGATCHVHMRGIGHLEPGSSIDGLAELIAASAITGAPVHVVHISCNGIHATPQLLQMIEEAQSQGLDVTTENYPYTTDMTGIESAILDDGWQRNMGIDYDSLEWARTGQRLTAKSFERYRKVGGHVIIHAVPEEIIQVAVTSPLTMIASDGFLIDGRGHPRTAGTFSRVLGRFVREMGSLTLMDALRKMTLMPAQRLEHRVPAMKRKGRVAVGADADLVLFDPDKILDRATYREPTIPSDGIAHVLINGVPVVSDGQLQSGITPGRPVRAP